MAGIRIELMNLKKRKTPISLIYFKEGIPINLIYLLKEPELSFILLCFVSF